MKLFKQALLLFLLLSCKIVLGQSAIIENLTGNITINELQAFKQKINSITYTEEVLYRNAWVYGTPSKNIEACGLMYEATKDVEILDRMIYFCDKALIQRNDKASAGNGGQRITFTGNIDPVWPSDAVEPEVGHPITAGIEQGQVLGYLAYCAKLILETPEIADDNVPDNDMYDFGVTYSQRALKYIQECNYVIDNWIMPNFIRVSENNHYYSPDDPAFTMMSPNIPFPWNQAMMLNCGLIRLVQCHLILNNEVSRVANYDDIVESNINWFKTYLYKIKSSVGTECLNWRYSVTQHNIEDMGHAAFVTRGFYLAYSSGRYGISFNETMVPFANTYFDIVLPTITDGKYALNIDGTGGGDVNYVRDDHLYLADIRQEKFNMVANININANRIGNYPAIAANILWQKSKRQSNLPNVPSKPGALTPVNGALDIIVTGADTVLTWTGSSNTSQYKIYLGKHPDTLVYIGEYITQTVQQAETPNLAVNGLVSNEAYYWRIDAHNSSGVTTGNINEFITLSSEQTDQKIVFRDNFFGNNSGGIINTESVPLVTYNSNLPTIISTSGNVGVSEGNLKFSIGTSPNLGYVSASSGVFLSPYKTVLSENTQLVNWYANLMYDRPTYVSSSMQSGTTSCAVILACDNEDPTAVGAKGYGVFLFRGVGTANASNNALCLVYFSNGINGVINNGSSNQTVILRSEQVNDVDLVQRYIAVKVTYNPTGNLWQLSFRANDGAFTNPLIGTFTDLVATANAEGTTIDMSNFAFASSYTSNSGNAYFDNFIVSLSPLPPDDITGEVVFKDSFTGNNNGGTINTMGVPSITYTSNVPTTINASGSAGIVDGNLKFSIGTSNNLAYVSGSSTVFSSPYKTKLSENARLVNWYANLRYDRSTYVSSSMSPGTTSCAMILACDKADPTDNDAKGYGVFLFRGVGGANASNNSLRLIYFSNGINGVSSTGTTGQTVISGSVTANGGDIVNKYVALKVSYNPTGNLWQLSFRADDGAFTSPLSGIYTDLAAVVNSEGVAIDMPNFAFASSYTSTSGNAYFDNFIVSLGNSVLPMQLISFKASEQSSSVKLSWQTASEKNNSHFEILRYSSANNNPVNLAQVSGSGNSNSTKDYIYTDKAPDDGTNYYQLRQVDLDGKATLSEVISVKTDVQNISFHVYQSADKACMVSINSDRPALSTLSLIDMTGRTLKKMKILLQQGSNIFTLTDELLTSGVYLVGLYIEGTVVKKNEKILIM